MSVPYSFLPLEKCCCFLHIRPKRHYQHYSRNKIKKNINLTHLYCLRAYPKHTHYFRPCVHNRTCFKWPIPCALPRVWSVVGPVPAVVVPPVPSRQSKSSVWELNQVHRPCSNVQPPKNLFS